MPYGLKKIYSQKQTELISDAYEIRAIFSVTKTVLQIKSLKILLKQFEALRKHKQRHFMREMQPSGTMSWMVESFKPNSSTTIIQFFCTYSIYLTSQK